MVSAAGVKFPPLMLERMLLKYAKVVRSLMEADCDRTGLVGRQDFAKIFRQYAVDIDEGFINVMDAFDRDGAGIDHKAFLDSANSLLFPPRPANAMTLVIPPSKFFEEKGHGRSKNFPDLKTTWNNNYFQQIDLDDEVGGGKPVLHGILSGKFYIVPNSQFRQVPQLKKVSGLEVDSSLNQPMSKSLMEGAYYHNPYENLPQTARSSKDFIQRNRAMSRHYSRLVSGARSVNASEMADRPMGTPRITGPFVRTGRPASKSMRAMAQDMPTPRNADQLQALWGRTLDPKFIASTLAWIAKASPEEVAGFKNAVASNSTLVPSRSPVYPDRAYTGQRPLTARPRLENTAPENPYLGKLVPKSQPQPPSARASMSSPRRVEPSAISAATAFVRMRQSPRVPASGPERNITQTLRVPTEPTSPKGNAASPRPPPISDDSPARGMISIQGTKVQPMAPPTASPRAGTPRARRMVTTAAAIPRATSNDLHSTLQVLHPDHPRSLASFSPTIRLRAPFFIACLLLRSISHATGCTPRAIKLWLHLHETHTGGGATRNLTVAVPTTASVLRALRSLALPHRKQHSSQNGQRLLSMPQPDLNLSLPFPLLLLVPCLFPPSPTMPYRACRRDSPLSLKESIKLFNAIFGDPFLSTYTLGECVSIVYFKALGSSP